jgi:16S rRNA (guanine1516-N2)-methyltransferase
VVRPLGAEARSAAARWAELLGLPLEADDRSVPARGASEEGGAARRIALEVGTAGLALRFSDGPSVSVVPRALARQSGRGRDLLVRAVGRVEPEDTVADATAGLGADAFRLAAHGVHVVMIEREPLVAALLQDALERAHKGAEGSAARDAAERMDLLVGDARDVLGRLAPPPAVVVVDPMFPETGKRALPNKGMALFRALLGGDADATELLEAALGVARRRVVVKRPRRAPALGLEAGVPPPSGSVVGTTTRYDLYAPRRPSP